MWPICSRYSRNSYYKAFGSLPMKIEKNCSVEKEKEKNNKAMAIIIGLDQLLYPASEERKRQYLPFNSVSIIWPS